MKYILNVWIAAVGLIGSGIATICYYCTGTSGFNFSWPVDGSRLSVNLTTIGTAVWVGIPLIVTGLLALLLAVGLSIVVQFLPDRKPVSEDSSSRHGILSLSE